IDSNVRVNEHQYGESSENSNLLEHNRNNRADKYNQEFVKIRDDSSDEINDNILEDDKEE
ncbi:16214_t:CDS:1, partial [Racocetra fulgida]